MPFVANEGAEIYWEEHGSGPPVLLIMGLSFTHEMWNRVLPSLTDRYRVIVLDNRGMGRSTVPRGPYTIPRMARDAVAVLRAAEVSRAHIVGASMGGMIAQELALRYPDLVRTLTLGCTSHSGLFGSWPEFRYFPRTRLRTRYEQERALTKLLYSDTTPEQRIEEDLVLRTSCQWSYQGFRNQLAAILMWTSYRRLPRILKPTLIVHGDQDRLVPPANGRVLATRIPGARFELIEGAGHVMTTDQPEKCCAVLRGFLDAAL